VNLGLSAESKFLVFMYLYVVLLKDNATSCRVKRHILSTLNHLHGLHAESKPDSTIFTQNFCSKIVTDFRKAEIVLHV